MLFGFAVFLAGLIALYLAVTGVSLKEAAEDMLRGEIPQ